MNKEKHHVYNTPVGTVEYTTSTPASEKAGKCKLCDEIVDPWVGRRYFAAIHIHTVHLRDNHREFKEGIENPYDYFEMY